MSVAAELLADLAARGVHLAVVGDRLRFHAPAGVLTAADRERLTLYKRALLEALPAAEDTRSVPGRATPETPAVAELRRHLALVWPVIEQGCRRGVQVHTTGIPVQKVHRLLTLAGKWDVGGEDFEAACRLAGDAATFCAVVSSYRRCLEALAAHGVDTRAEMERLDAALQVPHPLVAAGTDTGATPGAVGTTAESPVTSDAYACSFIRWMERPTTAQALDGLCRRITAGWRYRGLSAAARHGCAASYRVRRLHLESGEAAA
jgi:hypothetical protein